MRSPRANENWGLENVSVSRSRTGAQHLPPYQAAASWTWERCAARYAELLGRRDQR